MAQRKKRKQRAIPASPIDWSKYEKGTTGGPAQVPPECQAKPDTGSADDLWIRVKLTERPIPEEAMRGEDGSEAAATS